MRKDRIREAYQFNYDCELDGFGEIESNGHFYTDSTMNLTFRETWHGTDANGNIIQASDEVKFSRY